MKKFDQTLLTELIDILTPFEEYIKQLEANKKVILHKVLPWKFHLLQLGMECLLVLPS